MGFERFCSDLGLCVGDFVFMPSPLSFWAELYTNFCAEKKMQEDGKVANGNGSALILDIEDFKVNRNSEFRLSFSVGRCKIF